MDAKAFTTWRRKLNNKQRSFIEAFVGPAHGNASEAARMAGYSAASDSSKDLLANQDIVAIIKQRIEWKEGTAIQDEVTKFWSDSMRDSGTKMAERLKASELLAKFTFDSGLNQKQSAAPATLLDMVKTIMVAVQQNKPLPLSATVVRDDENTHTVVDSDPDAASGTGAES